MNVLIPLLTSLVSLLFAFSLLGQYLERRRPYQLVWAAGLFLYFLGAGAEFVVGAFGLSEPAFRTWYLAGAILVPAYLALGTVYLLAPKKLAHTLLALLLIITAYAVIRASMTGVDFSVPASDRLNALSVTETVVQGGAMTGRAWVDPGIRSLSMVAIAGAFVLIGGAAYSAVAFALRRDKPNRVVSNVLITAGALIPAIGGGLARRADMPAYLYVSELAGIIVIYAGFLFSQEAFRLYSWPFPKRRQAS